MSVTPTSTDFPSRSRRPVDGVPSSVVATANAVQRLIQRLPFRLTMTIRICPRFGEPSWDSELDKRRAERWIHRFGDVGHFPMPLTPNKPP